MVLQATVGLVAGAALASLFLVTLWLSASMAVTSTPNPVLFAAMSLARVAVVAAGFVLLARSFGPVATACGILAFIALRTLVVTRIRSSTFARRR